MSPQNPDLQAITAKIYDEMRELSLQVGKARGLAGLGYLIPAVISRVEEVQSVTAALTGDQKKEVAGRVLNLLINLPIIPEWIEAKIFGLAVDWFVEFFNRSFSKTWLPKVKELLGG